ncbi:MAG: TMEM165/GDT1 family protein [Thaumarchaeota archaeon]|nr:TMEM165/GDT1 family protein [Nitrososphaerota archaeon]
MGDPTAALLTVIGTIFLAELTDKDALLLLTLATKTNPWRVFAAGSIAFSITSAIIVLFGTVLVSFVPIFWIKLVGGAIMLGYAVFQYARGLREERNVQTRGEKLAGGGTSSDIAAFLAVLASLVVLDLAGDATELLTVIFVAQFDNLLLVFSGAVIALVAATALETILGNRLGKILSARRIRYLSIVVFLAIGSVVILSTVLTGV